MLLTGEPETGMEVTQHVLVLACLPDVLDSIGQLLCLYPGQLLPLQCRQRRVGCRVLRVRGRGLCIEKDGTKSDESNKKEKEGKLNREGINMEEKTIEVKMGMEGLKF